MRKAGLHFVWRKEGDLVAILVFVLVLLYLLIDTVGFVDLINVFMSFL